MKKVALIPLVAAILLLTLPPAGGKVTSAGPTVARLKAAGTRVSARLPDDLLAGSVKGATATTSSHWAGYVQAGRKTKRFTLVLSDWIVPTVSTKASSDQITLDWVGIDGYISTSKLVQLGTAEENLDGQASYFAWIELVPAKLKPLSLTIHPGDHVDASARERAPNKWELDILDSTTNQNFQHTFSYTTPGQSAEAILERPLSDGHLLTLAPTSNMGFEDVSVSTQPPGKQHGVTSFPIHYNGDTLYRIAMINAKGKVIAVPSAWYNGCMAVADGSKPPPPPQNMEC